VTASRRLTDGGHEMTSQVEFDAGGLLRGTPFSTRASIRLQMESRYHVDPTGNLQNFELRVKSQEFSDELVEIKGQLKGKIMEIVSRGPVPILNQSRSFAYEPRSVVHDLLGPLDRLPGLHVGQRWETRIINPFSGQVESVRVEVTRRNLIHWDGNPVSTFEVVQHVAPLATRTWVRTDGVVLRQEVPFPFVRLVLERRSEEAAAPTSAPTAGRPAP
jgi:hypothetical protein